jgi:Putative peptidoglycan binding domain
VIYRRSLVWPDPTLDLYDRPIEPWEPTSETLEEWGSLRIELGATWEAALDETMVKVLDGIDATTVNGVETRITSLEFAEPYGETVGGLTFPGLTAWSWAPWLTFGTNVDIWRVLPEVLRIQYGRDEVPYWHGFVASPNLQDAADAKHVASVHLAGALFGEASMRDHQPVMERTAVNVGTAIGRCLRPQAYSRPFAPFRFQFTPSTVLDDDGDSITTATRGSRGDSLLDHVEELLAQAQDATSAWTISRAFDADNFPQARTYYMREVSASIADAIEVVTVTAGTKGVDWTLTQDGASAPNMVFGEGLAPDGSRYRNAKYPMLTPAAPDYPGTMAFGATDLDYSYAAVTALQYQLRAAGWPDVQINGFFDADTRTALKAQQRDAGRTVDGTISGTADWASVWSTGSVSGDLLSGFFRPLGFVSAADPYVHASNGAVVDDNVNYDGRLQVHRTVALPDGIKKSRAMKYCQRIANQSEEAPWIGTVTLTADPQEMHRRNIREGAFLRLNGPRGNDGFDLYIAGVAHSEDGKAPTELTVSEQPIPMLDLKARIDRQREADADPAKLPLRNRPQRPFRDAVGWDKESGAGVIQPTVLSAGWNVIRFIGAERGTIAAVKAKTTSPASRFAFAVFGKSINPAGVAALVADPLSEEPDGYGWWNIPAIQDDLDDAWFVEAWGEFEQAAGYSPGKESSDHDVTGKLTDGLGWVFGSDDPPFLWAAVYVAAPCTFDAELRIVIEE